MTAFLNLLNMRLNFLELLGEGHLGTIWNAVCGFDLLCKLHPSGVLHVTKNKQLQAFVLKVQTIS